MTKASRTRTSSKQCSIQSPSNLLKNTQHLDCLEGPFAVHPSSHSASTQSMASVTSMEDDGRWKAICNVSQMLKDTNRACGVISGILQKTSWSPWSAKPKASRAKAAELREKHQQADESVIPVAQATANDFCTPNVSVMCLATHRK